MFKRTGEKWISTAATAKEVAEWAITAKSPRNLRNSLIAARVFTAFMFEGVVHHLGETLDSSWTVGDKRALSRQPLPARHKEVRRLVGLNNDDESFRDIRSLVERTMAFRDCFAHPKRYEAIIDDEVGSIYDSNDPSIAWENEIDPILIEGELRQIDAYCHQLLNMGADRIEETMLTDVNAYPHIQNRDAAAIYLRAYLSLPSMAGFNMTLQSTH